MKRGDWAPDLGRLDVPWLSGSSLPSRKKLGEGPDHWRPANPGDHDLVDLVLLPSGNERQMSSKGPK